MTTLPISEAPVQVYNFANQLCMMCTQGRNISLWLSHLLLFFIWESYVLLGGHYTYYLCVLVYHKEGFTQKRTDPMAESHPSPIGSFLLSDYIHYWGGVSLVWFWATPYGAQGVTPSSVLRDPSGNLGRLYGVPELNLGWPHYKTDALSTVLGILLYTRLVL